MTKTTLNVGGMSCGHCVNSIESTLKTLGIASKVNLSRGTVDLAFDETKVSLATIREVIEEQGFDVA